MIGTLRWIVSLWYLFPAALCSAVAVATPPESIRIDWSHIADTSNQIRVTERDGVLSILTDGNDPYFFFQVPALGNRDRAWMLEWEYFCPQGIHGLEWRSGRKLHDPIATPLPPIAKAEGWTRYTLNLNQSVPAFVEQASQADAMVPVRIDLGSKSGVRLQVRSIVVRPISDQEIAQQKRRTDQRRQKEQLAERIRIDQSRRWPATVTSIRFDGSQLRLIGRVKSEAKVGDVFVIARHAESVAANPPTPAELAERWPLIVDPPDSDPPDSDSPDSDFDASIELQPESRCREPGTRFQLVRLTDSGPEPISSAVYLPPHCDADIAPPKPLKAAKGLTCLTSKFSPSELRGLGLGHGSVNIVLTGLVGMTARAGWVQVEIGGKTWWVNEPRLKQLDRNVRTATDAGLVVAGILLIPTPSQHPSPIAHPESTTDGTYAMPNLTQPRAIAHYVATLEVLARRYAGDRPEQGRIDHWIVHNEVDYGWQWTNMGEQPLEIFMDHYVRSMRLVDHVVRQHNPHGRVFISLTHRWNTTDNRPWKTYAPKTMLQWLIRASRREGDFPWGVAYHPYPQSLWKADFWNDRDVSDDFDTRLITLKNLQVLDRFMQLESSRMADGRIRPVLCSEQGFHADEDDAQQLRIQAAALLRTWEKLRQCPTILAFDYHRPSDHPREGGLRLGLRGLPSATDPRGKPKPAWEVYSAIGTGREAEMLRRYQTLWE